jgi:hypothetical protein
MRAVNTGGPGHFTKHLDDKVREKTFEISGPLETLT